MEKGVIILGVGIGGGGGEETQPTGYPAGEGGGDIYSLHLLSFMEASGFIVPCSL